MGICESYVELPSSLDSNTSVICDIFFLFLNSEWLLTMWLFLLFFYDVDDVDTRAITRRLRQDGSLIGVLSNEESKTDEELLEMSRTWDIVGKDFF